MAATNKGTFIGAAIGTLIGSLAIAYYPKRKQILQVIQQKTGSLARRAQEAADALAEQNHRPKLKEKKKLFLAGSLLGVIAGAGTALLFAPKSGKMLRNQIVKACSNRNGKANDVFDVFHNHTHVPSKKRAHTSKNRTHRYRTAAASRN